MRTCRSGLCPRSGGSVYASVHDVHPVRRQSLPLHAMRRPEFARRHADRWSGLCPRSGGSVYMISTRSQAEPAPTRDAKAGVRKAGMRTCRSGLCPRSWGFGLPLGERSPPRSQAEPAPTRDAKARVCKAAMRTCRSGLCPRLGSSVYASVHDRHLRSQAEPAPTRDAKARVCKVAMRTCRSGLCPRLGGSVCASVHDLRPGRRQSLLLHAMRRPEFARRPCGPVERALPAIRGFGLRLGA